MPYWKRPVEWLTDTAVKEIVCLKCTRAGGSENVFLNAIRFFVANKPQPIMYLTGDQLTAERFMEKRVKRSMRCASETAKQYRRAQATQHDIAFPNMDFRVAWPKAKQAFKQDGWGVILFDELSMAPDGAQEQARRRVDSYPFPHIVWLSSMDPLNGRPSEEDPILIEYEDSDRCVWMMPDPKTGNPFQFTHGGLKWSPDAKEGDQWNLKEVERTAYYETPDGTRIDEADRLHVMRSGDWVPTNPKPTPKKRGVKVVAPMVPFADAGSFGALAKEFLTALVFRVTHR
jgi:phage terminase large subunit GpA-like protein